MTTDLPISRFLRAEPAYERLFALCNPGTLIRFSQTCKPAHAAVTEYILWEFSLERLLFRFFTNVDEFRELLRREGCLITGLALLLYIARRSTGEDSTPEVPLEVVVCSKNAKTVCNWLLNCSEPRYVLEITPEQKKQGWRTATDIVDTFDGFKRRQSDVATARQMEEAFAARYQSGPVLRFRSSLRRVYLAITGYTPLERVLSQSCSSLMNFITPDGAYCLFPGATFDRFKNVVFKSVPYNDDEHCDTIATLGWSTLDEREQRLISRFLLGSTRRAFEDSKTWKISFKGRNESGWKPTSTTLSRNTFTVLHPAHDAPVEIQFSVLKPGFFEEKYTASNEVACKAKFWFSLIRALESQLDSVENDRWDAILSEWVDVTNNQCTCSPHCVSFKFNLCPAFNSMFAIYGRFAQNRLSSLTPESSEDLDSFKSFRNFLV